MGGYVKPVSDEKVKKWFSTCYKQFRRIMLIIFFIAAIKYL